MWNTLVVSYYGKYQDEMTEYEKEVDLRCNARIATFDYYSTSRARTKSRTVPYRTFMERDKHGYHKSAQSGKHNKAVPRFEF